MRSLMIAAALHVGVLALASTPGSASTPEELGGNFVCGSQADKAAVIASAPKHHIQVVTLTKEHGERFLAVLNAAPPVTHMTADAVTFFRSADETYMGLDEGDKFCLSKNAAPNEQVDKMLRDAIGDES